MSNDLTAFTGAAIFDGNEMHSGHALLLRDNAVEGIVPDADVPEGCQTNDFDGGTIVPGFADLQVNGGGGVMLNDAPTVETLKTIAQAHAGLGATSILPTLITDTFEQVKATIEATRDAINQGVPGIAGLHLEGPHLSRARKGAHDPALIRPMNDADFGLLLGAAQILPVLKVTIAPESVTPEQISRLADNGVLLSLGHSAASFDQCVTAAENGVRCVTHLFNAMDPLVNRVPGLLGAALERGELSAGLIADLLHVHPVNIDLALRAKRGPGRIFLVSDAMATAGSDIGHFELNGRRINRSEGRLTLEDGTLAGADLDLATAIRNMWTATDLGIEEVLAMATSVPAALIGADNRIGYLSPDHQADFAHLSETGELTATWQGGNRVSV